MARDHSPVLGSCDLCGETIYREQCHYEMPDGDVICEECVLDWVAQYYVRGTVDLFET